MSTDSTSRDGVHVATLLDLPLSDPRRLTGREMDRLLREGLAWVDADGNWRTDKPDIDTRAAAILAQQHRIKRELLACDKAAIEVSRLTADLAKAEAAYTETHRQVHIAAIVEQSLANVDHHLQAREERIWAFFARNR